MYVPKVKEKQASFAIRVGRIFTILGCVGLVLFTAFNDKTSCPSSGSDTIVTTYSKLSAIVERLKRYSSHVCFLTLYFKNRCVLGGCEDYQLFINFEVLKHMHPLMHAHLQ